MKKITLTQGFVTLVDNSDYEELSKLKWTVFKTKNKLYAIRSGKWDGKKYPRIYMHRVIMVPKFGEEVDHINGDGLDNRRANIRLCSHSNNLKSQNIPKNNTTGYKGVYIKNDYNRKKKYCASIISDGKYIFAGHYITAREAAIAYNNVAIKYHGEFAKLNKV